MSTMDVNVTCVQGWFMCLFSDVSTYPDMPSHRVPLPNIMGRPGLPALCTLGNRYSARYFNWYFHSFLYFVLSPIPASFTMTSMNVVRSRISYLNLPYFNLPGSVEAPQASFQSRVENKIRCETVVVKFVRKFYKLRIVSLAVNFW
jgi:hypothetical protein